MKTNLLRFVNAFNLDRWAIHIYNIHDGRMDIDTGYFIPLHTEEREYVDKDNLHEFYHSQRDLLLDQGGRFWLGVWMEEDRIIFAVLEEFGTFAEAMDKAVSRGASVICMGDNEFIKV